MLEGGKTRLCEEEKCVCLYLKGKMITRESINSMTKVFVLESKKITYPFEILKET